MRALLVFLSLALMFSSVSFAAPFNARGAVDSLKASGLKLKFGKSTDTGFYVICQETVTVRDGNIAEAQEKAKMQARVSIAEFIAGAHIKVRESSGKTTKLSIVNDEESFESAEYIKKSMQKDVRQVQRGITICAMDKNNEQLTVYCLLVEKVISAAGQMAAAVNKLGPDTVQVSGIAYFGRDISQEAAEKAALAEAQKEAIAQVLGISITSTSASQTAAAESIGNDGEEIFDCDTAFKAKVFSSAAGFVEQCRIVDKQVNAPTLTVTIVAKVARDKLLNDYRSYLESMGNPGFCVRSNSKGMLDLCSGFFGSLGIRTVDNMYDAAYIVDVTCKFIESGDDMRAAVRIVVKDKVNETVLFSQENVPDDLSVNDKSQAGQILLARKILNRLRPQLHQKLNTFIGRANADGRKIQVKLCNYDSDYRASAKAIEKALKMVPGASNVRMEISRDEVVYTLNFKTETEDLADFLEKQIKVDIKRRSHRPVRGSVSNTLVEFNFE